MKFLCDAMLAHIGRKLRLAGYDTLIDQGIRRDRELLDLANREERYFLTCDHQIRQHKSSDRVLYLAQNDELSWARYLMQTLRIDWTYDPLSRCLECNTELRLANQIERQRLPQNILAEGQEGYYCEVCDKLYWNGSHVSKMRAKLDALNELS